MTVIDAALIAVPARDRAAPDRRRWVRPALVSLLLAGLTVEGVLAAPYIGRGAMALGNADTRWVAVALAAELVSMGAFARMRRRMLAAGGVRVSMRRMLPLTYAATAVGATFPGGSAVSSGYLFKRLRNWGVTVPAASFTVMASSLLSVSAYTILAVLSAIAIGRGGSGSILVLGLLGLAVVAALAVRRYGRGNLDRATARAVRAVNLVLRRPPESGLTRARGLVAELRGIKLRGRDLAVGLGLAQLNWLADLACLVACCLAVGTAHATLPLIMVAYVAGMSVSSVTLLPGGLGIVDAAIVVTLSQGGQSLPVATAGVLLFRLISFALVAAVGWLAVLAATTRARRDGGPAPAVASAQS